MDVFKLAFETTIVGLLTFVWLGVATYLLFPDFKLDSIKERLPALVKDNPTAIGIGALILAYCLGSAILPIANQLVNDEHWPLNESGIRCQVFTEQGHWLKNVGVDELPKGKDFSLAELEPGHCSYWAPIFTARPIGIRARIWRSQGIPGRMRRSRCIRSGECTVASQPQKLLHPCADVYSPLDKHPRKRCLWCRCTVRQSRKPLTISFVRTADRRPMGRYSTTGKKSLYHGPAGSIKRPELIVRGGNEFLNRRGYG